MPTALLLLREESGTSLASLVEKSQKQQLSPPLPQYDLKLSSNQLDLIQLTNNNKLKNYDIRIADDGFESDIDTISIISSDGSLVSTSEPRNPKEIDSGNGSTSSDSDNDQVSGHEQFDNKYNAIDKENLIVKESYNLVDCVCYTDTRVPDVLIFLIRSEAFVFKFENLMQLNNFYLNFTALKAVSNQVTYNKLPAATKFNLLQRTDNNGITHIEITRESENLWKPQVAPLATANTTSIISLNTPDISLKERKLVRSQRFSSIENLVDPKPEIKKKVWGSSESILDLPKRPERRKKGRAPPPPGQFPPQNILCGEYVRVNVNSIGRGGQDFIVKSQSDKTCSRIFPILMLSSSSNTSKPETIRAPAPLQWTTHSMPRLIKPLKSAKSKTDIRKPSSNTAQIENRLFGLSPHLRNFSVAPNDTKSASEWFQNIQEEVENKSSLKSVIKKVDNKKKNKKVTFSAYATVQVV